MFPLFAKADEYLLWHLKIKQLNIHKQIVKFIVPLGLLFVFGAGKTFAQVKDSLPEIILNSKRPISPTDEVVPVFQLPKKVLANLNSLSVAEAVKYIPGVLVKDYGGIGGLKTVSIRSLGANHTGVLYDGLLISDAQSGVVDLGKISLDNIESVTLYQAQPINILSPARSFASSSLLELNSQSGINDSLKKIYGNFSLNAGSFNSYSAATSLYRSLGKSWLGSLSAGWQRSKGDYPFRSYENIHKTAYRKNTDINSLRLEFDLAKATNDDDKIKIKGYYYQSERGLPGSVVLYNNESNQRLNDRNIFIQGVYKININQRNNLLFSSKLSYDYSDYTDPDFQNSQGKIQTTFHQKEAYFSAAYSYKIYDRLLASYASDFFITGLKRTDVFAADFENPTRLNFLNNVAVSANFSAFKIQANLLSTILKDDVKTPGVKVKASEISPAISAIWQPLTKVPVKLRAFYKNIFRAPSFNDLYYTNVGNTNLKPEYVQQYNLGITWQPVIIKAFKNFAITTDGYVNEVHDKIIAVPRQNLFQWTMLNIGKVEIKGVDVAARFAFKEWKNFNLSAMINYTYQEALDISSKNSALYKTQLPYTPEHSGSAHADVDYKELSFSYNILFTGNRYRLGEPVMDNLVQGFGTQDITFGYRHFINGYKFLLQLMVNNLSDNNYEVIKYYPMPGINYQLRLSVSF